MAAKKRRVLALLRVSSEAQAGPDRGGLPRQRAACEAIARANGLAIESWVELEGVSGASVLDEPAYRQMLARLREPDLAGVIVDDVSRLMRPERLSDYEILEAFRAAGKLLFTREGPKDVRVFGDRLSTVLQTELHSHARAEIARWTREGRERRRREGRRAEGNGRFAMPLGVQFDHASGLWSYVDPDASRVRAAFAAVLGGLTSLRAVARAAGLDQGRSRQGLSRLLASILRQPLYRGAYRVDRRWVKGRAVARAPEDVYERQVLEPPLVSPADWRRVQQLLDSRRLRHAPRREPGSDTTYHGHLDCAECGSVLWVTRQGQNRGAPSYLCGARRAGTCQGRSISARLADPVIDAALAATLGSAEALGRLLAPALEGAADRERRAARESGRRLAELDNRRRRVQEGYETGIYRPSEAAKRLADIDGETAVLRSALESPRSADLPPVALVARVEDVFASWGALRRAERRALMQELGVRVRLAVPAARRPVVVAVEVAAIGITR